MMNFFWLLSLISFIHNIHAWRSHKIPQIVSSSLFARVNGVDETQKKGNKLKRLFTKSQSNISNEEKNIQSFAKAVIPKESAKDSQYLPNIKSFMKSYDRKSYRSDEAFSEKTESDDKSNLSLLQLYLKETEELTEDLMISDNLRHFTPVFDQSESNSEMILHYEPTKDTNDSFKSGFVSIIGNPNVGKSTLMNVLLKQKLSIVSAKPQTTRHRIHGILTKEDQYQIIFMDTPGMIYNNKAVYTLHETMQSVIRYAARDTDVLLLITDVFGDELQDDSIMERLTRVSFPVVVIINKVDLLPEMIMQVKNSSRKSPEIANVIHPNITLTKASINSSLSLDSIVSKWKQRLPNADIIPVSAAYNYGASEVLEKIVSYLPKGPKYYPSDYVSDRDERFFAAELIRESIFELFTGDVPYSCEVYIEDFKDITPTFSKIAATIYVNRKPQVSIIVGRDGQKVKEVGIISRQKIENFLQRKVYLELQVKNDPEWRSRKESLKKFGYLEEF